MSARRVKDIHFVALAGILTAILAGAAAFITPTDASATDTLSSFSAAPGGGKAAFLTLSALGYRIERSYEPMTAIAAAPARTVLLVTGTGKPSELDRRALEAFLEAGGHALLVGGQGADFLGVQGAGFADPFTQPSTYRAVTPSPLAVNVPEITMAPVEGAPKFGPTHVVVFRADDNPLVTVARVGKGRAVWLAAPTPLANAHIAVASNLQLLLNAVGDPGERDLLWDEHYHGHLRSLWSYTARTPLPWIGAQLGVVLIAALATYSRRRGPVRARRNEARTSALEFVDMLGTLYRRAGAASAAVAAARMRLRRTVAAAHGIPADSPDATMARAIATRTGADESEALDVLAAAAADAVDPHVGADAALKLSQRLQQFTESVRRTGS
jgi:hypothetical protein